MIVKMSQTEYNELKEKYIYKISKNGLITTNAIDKRSYLFRTTSDNGFKRYLKVTDASEDFLRLVIAETSGNILTFIEDVDTKDDIVKVDDELIPPAPLPPEVLQEEIAEAHKDVLQFRPYTELVYEFQDYEGFQSY